MPYHFNADVDASTGYRICSMLTMPLLVSCMEKMRGMLHMIYNRFPDQKTACKKNKD